MCYGTRRTHPLLYCASTTAAGATTALAATSATFAGCIGRLAGTAATASAGATDGGPALKDYSETEAREAYERVAKFHGWPTQRRHS